MPELQIMSLKDYFERHLARASVSKTAPPPFPGRSPWRVEGEWSERNA